VLDGWLPFVTWVPSTVVIWPSEKSPASCSEHPGSASSERGAERALACVAPRVRQGCEATALGIIGIVGLIFRIRYTAQKFKLWWWAVICAARPTSPTS
jgi:hypothetical protein